MYQKDTLSWVWHKTLRTPFRPSLPFRLITHGHAQIRLPSRAMSASTLWPVTRKEIRPRPLRKNSCCGFNMKEVSFPLAGEMLWLRLTLFLGRAGNCMRRRTPILVSQFIACFPTLSSRGALMEIWRIGWRLWWQLESLRIRLTSMLGMLGKSNQICTPVARLSNVGEQDWVLLWEQHLECYVGVADQLELEDCFLKRSPRA